MVSEFQNVLKIFAIERYVVALQEELSFSSNVGIWMQLPCQKGCSNAQGHLWQTC